MRGSLAALMLLATVHQAHTSLLGIDLGSQWMKVALVKPGVPFQIVTNTASKRKTATMVAFGSEGERLYAGDAENLAKRKPQQVFPMIRSMLGRNASHPVVKTVTSLISEHVISSNEDRNGALRIFNVLAPEPKESSDAEVATEADDGASEDADGADEVIVEKSEEFVLPQNYAVEELMGFVLSYARKIGEDMAEGPVKDCVITVPSFFTQAEREAVLDAAATVKLNVLNLIDENTAAAVQFGVDRSDRDVNKTHTVMYYNLGSSSLQVSIAQYSTREVKRLGKNVTSSVFTVLAKAWDEGVGGIYFDTLVAHSLAEYFNDYMRGRRGIDADYDVRTSSQRGWAKIKAQAAKTKKVLSANEAIPVYISSVDQDQDLKGYKLSRSQLEEMSKDLLARVIAPVDEALLQANLTAADIDAVEIIGGGSRMPKVQQLLKERMGMSLSVHLNGDEAMALGAAFHAANLSKAFRVRHVGMQDLQPLAIGVRLRGPQAEEEDVAEDDGEEAEKKHWSKRATLFKSNSRRGSKKLVSFTHPRNFACVLAYDGELPAGASRTIRGYNVTGLEALLADEKYAEFGLPKVNLAFFLDTQGLVALTKADAVFEETVEYEVQELVKEEETETKTEADAAESSDDVAAAADAGETTDADAKADDADAAVSNEEAKEETAPEETDEAATEEKEATEAAADEAEATEEAEEATDGTEEAAAAASKIPDGTTAAEEVAEVVLEAPKYITVTKTRKKKHRRPLTVTPLDGTHELVFGSTFDWPLVGLRGGDGVSVTDDLKIAHALMETMDRADEHRQKHAEATNSLESFVYAARSFVRDEEHGAFEVTTEEEREEILELLMEAEDWLYEVELSTPISTIMDRRALLSDRTEAIRERVSEQKARPAALASLRASLDAVVAHVELWPKKKPQITDEETAKVMEKVTSLREWANEMESAQAKLGPTDEPAFKSEQVARKAKSMENKLRKYLSKPKIKTVKIQPPLPPAPKNATETAPETTATDEETTSETPSSEAAEGSDESAEAAGKSSEEGEADSEDSAAKDEL